MRPVHILVARGSGEPPGTGAMGSLADLVLRSHPKGTVEAIDYPVALDPYIDSVTKGINAVTDQLADYVHKCPGSQIVLTGVSQGIHVCWMHYAAQAIRRGEGPVGLVSVKKSALMVCN